MLPALANKVTPNNVHIPSALSHLFAINWLYGFVASSVLYYVFNLISPDRGTLLTHGVSGDIEYVEGLSSEQQSAIGDIDQSEKGFQKRTSVEVASGIE